MKRLLGFAAAIGLSALPGAALAASLTFTDTKTFSPVCLSTAATPCQGGAPSFSTKEFELDISDSGFVNGSLITSAEIVLKLSDDGGSGDGSEKLSLLVDGASIPYSDNANHDAVITLTDFTSLSEDGKLIVVVGATTGDFFLSGGTLTVVDDPAAPGAAVPAPAALVLVGAGLVGTAWRRYRAR